MSTKPGRNEPCSCGSGKKYKHCCEGKVKPRLIDPPPADMNQLVALYNARRFAELESRTRTLLMTFPNSGFAWKLLGAALQMQGKQALPAFQKTTELMPNNAEAFFNLGVVQKSQGLLQEAAASYRRAIQNKPDYAEAHDNLGNVFKELGMLSEAVASYRRALSIKPGLPITHNNLGTALQNSGNLNAAIESYQKAIQLKFDYTEACFNLANAFRDCNRLEEALQYYGRTIEIKPDFVDAHVNLGVMQKNVGLLDDSVASFHRALELNPDCVEAQGNLVFAYHYSAKYRPEFVLEQAREYGRIVSKRAIGRYSSWNCAAQPQRLRVGMVSGDFRTHSVGHFLASILPHIDSTRVELVAYSTHATEDTLTDRIKPAFCTWKSLVGISDEDAARLIHDDGIHVLIDVSGHTAHNRLPMFAWKPAPIQATWLGFPSTTGLCEIDYVLGDRVAIPPENEHHFSESVWRLPNGYLCFAAPVEPVDVAPLPALASGQVTFGSFNNLTKMNDGVVELWARILGSAPHTRLCLKAPQLSDQSVCRATYDRFAKFNIGAERLQLVGRKNSLTDHLKIYHQIDIALDTFPYPGVTTSIEALWMGVPVLTLHGECFMSLTASSVAHFAGMQEWISLNEDDYVSKALTFSSDLPKLAELRANLRNQVLASPLFDVSRFADDFVDALWSMWLKRA